VGSAQELTDEASSQVTLCCEPVKGESLEAVGLQAGGPGP
jgi:hypothetical protein